MCSHVGWVYLSTRFAGADVEVESRDKVRWRNVIG